MEIQWLGDTTFLIKNSTGKRILINPFDLNCSIKEYDFHPDIITISNTKCSNVFGEYINKGSTLIDSCGAFTNEYLSIHGYNTYCDNINGLKRGNNIIYIFEIEKLKFCHLGTLGHKLNSKLLSILDDLDFLLIPIGGHFSLDGNDAASLASNINAKYIIPMFYKPSLQQSYLDGPYKFISHMKNIINLNNSTINTTELSFDTINSVIILK